MGKEEVSPKHSFTEAGFGFLRATSVSQNSDSHG